MQQNVEWLVQERRNSIAIALELRRSCTNLLTYGGGEGYQGFFLRRFLLCGIFLFSGQISHYMSADALAPCVTRASSV